MMQADLFSQQRAKWNVAIDNETRAMLAAGAGVAFNLSGGKDSMAIADAANEWLDAIGHPRSQRVALHADLGRIEWKATPRIVEQSAAALHVPLSVVRHGTHDMISRWERRHELGRGRFERMEVYNMIGPWSSSALRFCTAEMKAQVMGPWMRRRFPQGYVAVVGIRREESAKRKNAPISKPDGKTGRLWHPGVDWTLAETFERHQARSLPLHPAYTEHDCTRMGCAFCVLQSIGDQRAAARVAGNREAFLHLVGIEATSGYSFQPDNWLADAAPGLLSAGLVRDHDRARAWADRRRAIEAGMPPELRYCDGWPQRLPTYAEAVAIVDAREELLAWYGLENVYPTANAVQDRFAELIALRIEAETRKAARVAKKAQRA